MVSIAEIPSTGGAPASACTSCNPNGHCGNGLEKVYPTCAVRYGAMNYIGEFRYAPGMLFGCGQKVVVQSDRGTELGQQVSLTCSGCSKSVSRDQIRDYVKNSGADFLHLNVGRIIRVATDSDLKEDAEQQQQARTMLREAADMARRLDMDLKMVCCEYLLGGERAVFYFNSEGRVDFRGLVRELVHQYHTRIEMRQVGARDEARLVADYEICGRECCCKTFLKTLRPVNMRMAKLQKATLDPSKVSGRCGRLRCCLRYEHETYEELAKKLPRVGKRVNTQEGIAIVVDRQILTQLLQVEFEDGRRLTFPIEEISPVAPVAKDEPQAPRRGARPSAAASADSTVDSDIDDPADSASDDALDLPPPPPHGDAAGDGPPRPAGERGPRRRRRRRRGGPGNAASEGSAE